MDTRKLSTIFSVTVVLLASAFTGVRAQSAAEDQDVVIWNQHLHVHKVYVFDARGEAHFLGFVGHDELESFDVPSKVEALGPYRIAVQQHFPLPGLGVPAIEHPFKMTSVLDLRPDRTVSIIVGDEAYLSTVDVF